MSTFKTSSFCSLGDCVEVALAGQPLTVAHPKRLVEGNCDPTSPGYARVRNTKNRSVVLEFDQAEWAAFVAGVKAGEFDDPTGGA
jgi:uncharacterized protein DUF397